MTKPDSTIDSFSLGPHQPKSIPWRIYLLISIIGLIIIGTLSYGFLKSVRMTEKYAPLVDAAMEIKLEATTAHLLFEEIISGDLHEDINVVWKHHNEAEWYAQAMLQGGKNSEGTFIPLEDTILRTKIIEVQEQLAEFRRIANQRIEFKQTSGVGTAIDQRFDHVFQECNKMADEVETRLQQIMTKDLIRYKYTQGFLIAACILLFLVAGKIFHRFDTQRTNYLISLSEMNQEALQKNEALLQYQKEMEQTATERSQLIDTANAPIFGVDVDGNINEWNQMVARITGYGKDEASGKNLVDHYISDEYKASVKEVLDKALEGEESDNFEVPLFTKGGDRIMVLLNANTRRDADGNIVGIVGVGQDITELSAHRENLEGLVETRTAELRKALSDTEYAKEKLLQSQESLTIRNEIAEVFLTDSDQDTFGNVSGIILKMLKSEYGFFGYINEEGNMVAPSMSGHMMEECRVPGKSFDFPRKDWGGIWGRSMIEKKSIYLNEGLHFPKGHVVLTRAMSVPILYQEELIGILAVANKETDYDENDQEILEVTANHISSILQARLQRDSEEIARGKAEKKLQESLADTEKARDRIDGILKSVADGLIVTDVYNRVILMNRPAEDFLGVRFSEVIDRPIDFAIKEKTLREKVKQTLARKTTGYLFDFELPGDDLKHPKIMRARTSVIHDREGKDSGIITTIHDVTHEREVDRMKTEFISTAAHELRTPLTSIQGFSEILLMREDLKPEDRKKFLTYINKQSVGLAAIINDLLNISRIESGRGFALNKEPCEAGETIQQIVPYFQEHYTNHQFEMILPEESLELFCDKEKMGQVLKNLLSNAAKYSPEGGPIRVVMEKIKDHCRISVQDQGMGMTPEQVDKVFEKFYRVDASNTAIEGTGLGTTVVKYIVEAHGGKVWVESELGKGTAVRFTIPV